jgi:sphinganine-1-phosphate aldolase
MKRAILPASGMEKESVLDVLREMQSHDIPFETAKFNLLTPYADDRFYDVGLKAMDMFSHYNASLAGYIPSVTQVMRDITGIAMSLQNAPEEAGAAITSGGTESIFTAMWAARDYWREQNPTSTAVPEVIAASTVHAAFQKSAHLLGMTLVMTEFDETFRCRPGDIEERIGANTAMIVGSAPAYPHGVFDPIEALSDIAMRRGVWLHVDACVGGYVSPFAEKLGIDIPPYDFRLPGVRSMSADLHKHAYVPKGISTLIYRDAKFLNHQTHTSEGWAFGAYRSTGFPGSRPSHVMAAAWAILHHLGEEGYLGLVQRMYEARDRLIGEIAAMPGMYILGAPESNVFAFTSDSYDPHAVAEKMAKLGWYLARIQSPRGLHIQCDPFDDDMIDRAMAALRGCVDEVAAEGLQSETEHTGY